MIQTYHSLGGSPNLLYKPMRGKVGFSATPGSKTPEPIATKLGVRNYVVDPTLNFKYGSDRVTWVLSAHA